jgi:hypothetical protein
MFRAAEDFVDRYENVALAGFNYHTFVPDITQKPPFTLNTRIYSCILIRNDLPFRWRGKYNEDTDLSLRVLKSGMCTVLFNAFLCFKQVTMTGKGGNTEEVYEGGKNRKEFVESLIEQHPDVVKMSYMYGRPHHTVNYKSFRKNALVLKDHHIPKGVNEYCMNIKSLI